VATPMVLVPRPRRGRHAGETQRVVTEIRPLENFRDEYVQSTRCRRGIAHAPMSPDAPQAEGAPRWPDLDPGVAQSAGLGSIGVTSAGSGVTDPATSDAGSREPGPTRGTGRGASWSSRRVLVAASAGAIAAAVLVVGGVALVAGNTTPGSSASGHATGRGRLAGASLATARARYASAVITYERDLRAITMTSALALTGNGSYSNAVAAWNQFSTDTQGLSSAALGIPATSTTVHDVEALITANTDLQAAIPAFEQNPTSQSNYSNLKRTLLMSAASAAHVERDLGLAPGGLQMPDGASLAAATSP
jgi:hypothetical protein